MLRESNKLDKVIVEVDFLLIQPPLVIIKQSENERILISLAKV